MLFEAGEFTTTAEQQRQQIVVRAKEGTGVVLLCVQGERIIGILFGMRSPFKRIHHILYLVLGVQSQWHRQGIGYRL